MLRPGRESQPIWASILVKLLIYPLLPDILTPFTDPGYLGSSSHASIFNHVLPGHDDRLGDSAPNAEKTPLGQPDVPVNNVHISSGANLINEIRNFAHISSCRKLVEAWIMKGVNLALASPFTARCAQSSEYILDLVTEGVQDATEVSRNLCTSSCRSLLANATTTIEDFCTNFCQANSRWETLGLFFAAVSRATTDSNYFEELYETEQQRQTFQRLAMYYSDRCLDTSLTFDCLNDLQLVLQYENFIAHSFVDGDQSESSHLRNVYFLIVKRLPRMEKAGRCS